MSHEVINDKNDILPVTIEKSSLSQQDVKESQIKSENYNNSSNSNVTDKKSTETSKDDDCLSSSDDEGDQMTSNIMNIISSKHKEIEQTFSLIKGDPKSVLTSPPNEAFGGLTRLVQDDKVKSMISNVAGHGTTAIIDETLSVIQGRSSMEAKQAALRKGIAKLQINLATNETATKDPAFKLLMNVMGKNGMNKLG